MTTLDAELEAELRRWLLPSDDDTDNEEKNEKHKSRRKEKSSMDAVERLVLSPWEKWIDHGRFPFKLALHVTLVLLTFARMQLFDAQNAAYMRASHRNWAFFFLPPAANIGVVPRFQRDFYTINRTMTAVQYLRDSYFSICNTSVANYEYLRTYSGEIQPLKMTVGRVLPHGEMEMREYLVSQDDDSVGPFDPKMTLWQKKHLVRSLNVVMFSFPLRDHQYGNFYEECFECMRSGRRLVLDQAKDNLETNDYGLHDVTSEDNDSDRSQVYGRQCGSLRPWTKIRLMHKLQLLNSLQLLVLTTLVLLLLSTMWSLLFLEAHMPIRFWDRLLHATALLLLWSCLVGYLEHNQHIYSIVLTLKWETPRVLQFLLGVSPIFVGYALFGTIYFGNKIEEFGTLSASMITLFSLMNGDIIMDTFDTMELHHFIVSGKVYLYSFISLFMYVILNIFIAIVEEAFFATQSTRRRLSDYLSDPRVSRVNVAKESEISAASLHALLRLMDSK